MRNRLSLRFGGGTRTHLVTVFAGSLLVSLMSRGLAILSNVLLARVLSANAFGVYASVFALITLIGFPVTRGIPAVLIRFVASYEVSGDWALLKGVVKRVPLLLFSLSMFIALVGVLVLQFFQVTDPEQSRALLWALASLPFAALCAGYAASLRGLHRVVLGLLPENILIPGIMTCGVSAALVLGGGIIDSAADAMLWRLGATVGGLVFAAAVLYWKIPKAAKEAVPLYRTREWVVASIPLLFFGGMAVVTMQTDVLMLAAFSGAREAGVYRAASSGAELVAFSLSIVATVSQPTLSKLYASGDLIRLQRVVSGASAAAFAFAVPAAAVLTFFGPTILRLTFGTGFVEGSLALSILCVAQAVNAGAGPVAALLNMTGHERVAAGGLALGAVVNLILNGVLIPIWGINGAAVATGVSLVVWNIFLVRQVRRKLGVATTPLSFNWRRPR